MTTNFQLADKLNKFKGFLGVFTEDTTPKKIGLNQAFITNLESAAEGGSHWVCVLGGAGVEYENIYFDSFGFHPPDYMKPMLFGKKREFYFSSSMYQEPNAISCGEFCVFIVASFLTNPCGGNKEKIYDLFYGKIKPEDYGRNETTVRKFFRSL